MSEKRIFNEANAAVKKERFEFVLMNNENVVCQRYFRIPGFRPQVVSSVELTDTIDRVARLIKNDLASKSRVYLWHTAPQVYANAAEMEAHLPTAKFTSPITYIILRDTEEVFVWNGETVKPYNGYFNVTDYVGGNNPLNNTSCVLKFTFYDNGNDLSEHKEIMSVAWDGSEYPRFIRNNIDISNYKNKYKEPETFSAYEAALVTILNEGREDLIPIIVNEITECCTSDEERPNYTRKVTYGDKEYGMNVYTLNERYEKNVEKQYQRKTEAYFRSLRS